MATSERLLLDHEFIESTMYVGVCCFRYPDLSSCREPRAAHYATEPAAPFRGTSTAGLPDPVPCPKCSRPSRISSAGGECFDCLMAAPAAPEPVESEAYSNRWVRLDCMVSRAGDLRVQAIGGEREPGVGDTRYIGLDRILAALDKLTLEREAAALAWMADCSADFDADGIRWMFRHFHGRIAELEAERDALKLQLAEQTQLAETWRLAARENALATKDTEIAGLRARLDDATAYCSGEFPCEASTSAASLERERNNLLDQVSGLRRQLAEAEALLRHLADDPHQAYDHPNVAGHGEYSTGIADGHRCAAAKPRAYFAARAAATKGKQP